MSEAPFVPPHLVGTVTIYDADEVEALLADGATVQRHAHQMRLTLPVAAYDNAEFVPFAPDAAPPVPWETVIPSFVAAYPPEHPDFMPGGAALIDSYLVPYTAGAQLGPLICHASALALRDDYVRDGYVRDDYVRDDYVYGGILIVDRPDEGPWVCDIWRDPRPEYAGTGAALLRWAAARLDGFDSLGLVVTVGNEAALRAYERVGFRIESTAWTVRLPSAQAPS